MAFVVTRPCRIGGLRKPGEVLSGEELRGRNLRQMEDVDRCIRFDPSVPEPDAPASETAPAEGAKRKPTRGRAKAEASETAEPDEQPEG